MSNTSLDMYSQFPWLGALESSNPLAETFLANQGIMEIMSLKEPPWIDTHHHSSFLHHPMIMPIAFEESSSPIPPLIVTRDGQKEIWVILPKRY